MTHDPEVEAGAIALAFVAKPAAIKATPQEWWEVVPEVNRLVHRYRASVVLEAVDEMRLSHAAE